METIFPCNNLPNFYIFLKKVEVRYQKSNVTDVLLCYASANRGAITQQQNSLKRTLISVVLYTRKNFYVIYLTWLIKRSIEIVMDVPQNIHDYFYIYNVDNAQKLLTYVKLGQCTTWDTSIRHKVCFENINYVTKLHVLYSCCLECSQNVHCACA